MARQPTAQSLREIRCKIVHSAPAAAIVALYKAGGWWHESTSNRRLIPRMIRNSFAFAIACTAQGEIIGMGRIISDGVSDAYIQDVVVLQAYRGKKIGRMIIKTLTDYCVRKKIGWIGLVAEPGTYPFYRRIGFKDKKGFQLMLFGKGEK